MLRLYRVKNGKAFIENAPGTIGLCSPWIVGGALLPCTQFVRRMRRPTDDFDQLLDQKNAVPGRGRVTTSDSLISSLGLENGRGKTASACDISGSFRLGE